MTTANEPSIGRVAASPPDGGYKDGERHGHGKLYNIIFLRLVPTIGPYILRKPVILSYIIRSEGDPPTPRGGSTRKNTKILGFKNNIFFGSKTPYFLYFRIKNSIFSLACGAPSRTELTLESSVNKTP